MTTETLKPVMKKPRCYFCKREVTEMDYCYGCGEYVCQECTGEDPPGGKHKVEDHKRNTDG